jgi:hypothetical protein
MTTSDGRDNHDLIAALHRAHEDVTSRQLSLLEIVARCDDEELWRKDGARDTVQWLAAHLGISHWAARRWVNAAHALPLLPHTRNAFGSGRLGTRQGSGAHSLRHSGDRGQAPHLGAKGDGGGRPPAGRPGDRERPRRRKRGR